MMKKGLFLLVLALMAASSFAQDIRNRYLYIEGMASKTEHYEFFRSNFAMEANGAGYVVTSSRNEALHTLRFTVTADSSDPDYEQYVLNVSLQRNEDDLRLIAFDFYFSNIEEMFIFTRTLFLNATANIPLPILTEERNQWNKWLYFRASFDYPITFYVLQPTGLKGGAGLYDSSRPGAVSPTDHKIMAMPGATVGFEGQFFNFLSLELNFQMSMGDTRNNFFVNMGAGAEIRYLWKMTNIMLAPYGAFLYTFSNSPTFYDFPPFSIGGGIQLCTRGGRSGAFFADVKYMISFGDAVMHNHSQHYPEPAVIYYNRSHIGIAVGYKIGFWDRK
jgi:hypothetical protein